MRHKTIYRGDETSVTYYESEFKQVKIVAIAQENDCVELSVDVFMAIVKVGKEFESFVINREIDGI